MAWLLTRYLALRVLLGIALVSALLLGLFTLVELIREARALTGDYGPPAMLVYLLQTTPRRLYDIFPFSALIGTLIGLSGLASGNELVAMRSAGFDRGRIMLRALAAVSMCLLVLMLVAEWLIPDLEAQARSQREQARTGQVQLRERGALWLRDGEHVLRVGQAAWHGADSLVFADVTVYTMAAGMQTEIIRHAHSARHEGQQWVLIDARRLAVGDQGEAGVVESTEHLASGLSPDLFAATVSRPRLLSLSDLRAMTAFLEDNGLDAERYRQAFWTRIYFPVNVLAMVLIGLPLVFSNARSGQRGLSLFAGVGLGIAYFVLIRVSQGVAVLLPLPMGITSLLPALLIVMVAVVFIRRL
ncbi:MAG: LPS export ABC transporter permease LptG [Wenzhouxiangella sp.]